MKTLTLPVITAIVLGLIGFLGSPFLVQMNSSYLGIRLVVLSPTDSEFPRNSLTLLLTTCSISAALLFWLYARWYRKSSIRIYFGVLAAALVVAAVGVVLNLFQLQAILKQSGSPIHRMLSMRSMIYFEWGAWPVIVITVIALIALFFLQPEDPNEQDDADTQNNTSA